MEQKSQLSRDISIVLVHPDIPQNTGSIARTAAALHAPLHLIEPLGFNIDEKKIRRAGLDYWPYVDLTIHKSWEAYLEQAEHSTMYFLSTKGARCLFDTSITYPATFVFGSETKGLPKEIMETAENLIKIPMLSEHVRSLNLSNAASIVVYEGLRQLRIKR